MAAKERLLNEKECYFMRYFNYGELCARVSNTWFTVVIGERMARIKSYKQAYMKEFNVTSEEYDKLYDVYALRARRYEKIHNVKLNKAKEFYWTAKLKKQGEPISERRKEIASTKASTKPIRVNEEETAARAYIELHFMGLIKRVKYLQEIYNSSLSWLKKRKLIEDWIRSWREQKENSAESSDDFEYSDGSVGYDFDYET